VANPTRPARAWWLPINGDLATARRRVAEATGTPEPLVITACGYGDYGQRAHRLGLDVLCAINQVADMHELPAAVVGTWLAIEGGLTSKVNAADLPAAFAEVYIGRFSHQQAYTAWHLDELGWTKTLRELGAWKFLDTAAVNRHLFNEEVHAIRDHTAHGEGIVVCRRHRHS
jgi:hypothetical protein